MPPDKLLLTKTLLDEILAQAREQPHEEVCGILGGENEQVRARYPIPNASPMPAYHFELEGKSFVTSYLEIEKQNMEVVAIYHSHPRAAAAIPSATDIANANYPDALNLIVSFSEQWKPIARVYKIVDGQVTEVELEIVEDD